MTAASGLDFLAGGGTMGALMRAKDWSATPLGPASAWPQSLRTSVSTCLNCSFPILIWWGPDLVKLYNDAYAAIIAEKHPRALGSPGREVWPEIWDTIGPMLGRVMDHGEATPANDLLLVLHRRGFPEECYFSFSYSPIRDETGRVGGVFCPVIETTARVLGERRSAFLLDLESRLRDVPDPVSVKATVSALLGKHLGVAQLGYSEVDADGERVAVEGDWTDGRAPSTAGVHRFDDYGRGIAADLRRNKPVAVADVAQDRRTASADKLARFAAFAVGSFLSVPLVNAGRLVAVLFAAGPAPRLWTDYEAALMRDVAERAWSAVERTRAEAALRESEARWRTFFQHMHEGFALCEMVYDADGTARDFRYLEVNPAVERLTGIALEAIAGRLASDAIPGIEPFWIETYARVVATGEPAHFEYAVASLGRWFEVYAYRTEPGRFGALFLNVTERKQTEAALRENEALLQAVFDAAPVGIVIGEAPTGRIARGNRQAEEILGHPIIFSPDVESYKAWVSHHPDGRQVEGHEYPLARVLGGEERPELEVLYRRGDGRDTWVRFIAAPIRSEGRITGGVVATLDIDRETRALRALDRTRQELEGRVEAEVRARETAQARLAHAQRMEALGQLAGGIAHDFNNVLQAVSGGLSLIDKRAGDPEDVRQIARMVCGAAERGASVTARLLSFARKAELRAVPVPAAPLLAELQEILTSTLGSAIAIRIDATADAPALLADKAQLETVLVNLAVNARDAMPEGGVLTLSARPETVATAGQHPAGLPPGAYLRLAMSDTGVGMEPAILARASEPFFTTKGPGKGTGLGLAMARGFAQQSGGGLTISSAPGRGTTVTLWFPQGAGADRAQAMPLAEAAAPVRSARVLLVDDDAMVRGMLARQLEELGYDVLQASDGLAGLAWLDRGERMDLLVTDFSMPGMNGLALTREARRRQAALPVLLLTGYADANAKLDVAAMQDEALVLLRKPVSGDELAQHAATLLTPRTDASADGRVKPGHDGLETGASTPPH